MTETWHSAAFFISHIIIIHNHLVSIHSWNNETKKTPLNIYAFWNKLQCLLLLLSIWKKILLVILVPWTTQISHYSNITKFTKFSNSCNINASIICLSNFFLSAFTIYMLILINFKEIISYLEKLSRRDPVHKVCNLILGKHCLHPYFLDASARNLLAKDDARLNQYSFWVQKPFSNEIHLSGRAVLVVFFLFLFKNIPKKSA